MLGVRISERMAGKICFLQLPPNNTNIVKAVHYPFEININAFCKTLNYPFSFNFQGRASFIGLPLERHCPEKLSHPTVTGEMKISHKGVYYNFSCELPGLGLLHIEGQKQYIFKTFSWKKIRDSLVTLPIVVTIQNLVVGKGTLSYPLPLWRFPLGIRFVREKFAYSVRAKLCHKILSLVPFFVPTDNEKIKLEQTFLKLCEQIEKMSYFKYKLLTFSYLFFCLLRFFRGGAERVVLRMSGQKLVQLILLPLSTIILGAHYSQRKFLEDKKQNIPLLPKHLEEEKWMSLVQTPTEENSLQEFEADVVIVGSGAGGGPMAYELARKGYAVIVIEEGHYFKRPDFSGDRIEMMNKLYSKGGWSFSWGNAPLWIPTGCAVGGTTTINSGTCMRPSDELLKQWGRNISTELLALEKYFPEVERMLGAVSVPEKYQGGISQVLEKGCKKLGFQYLPLKRAEIGCDGQSYCILGCPAGAKRSTDISYIPEALKKNAYLFTHYKVTKILQEKNKAIGVLAQLPGHGSEFSLKVRAKAVVLAAGTFGTPQILHESGLRHPQLGKNLSVHPALSIGGLFPYKVRESFFVPQSFSVKDKSFDNFILEGYTIPTDTIPLAFQMYGKDLKEIIDQSDYFTNFAVMTSDVCRGRLRLGHFGVVPTYFVSKRMNEIMRKGIKVLGEIFFAAEAKNIYIPITGLEKISSAKELEKLEHHYSAYKFALSAYHPLGTCQMGSTKMNSVVDPMGELWELKNLFVCDGSAIPGPLGVNPQVTIMANALRVADYIRNNVL